MFSIMQEVEATKEKKQSDSVVRKITVRVEGQKLDSHLEDCYVRGRPLPCNSSRPALTSKLISATRITCVMVLILLNPLFAFLTSAGGSSWTECHSLRHNERGVVKLVDCVPYG